MLSVMFVVVRVGFAAVEPVGHPASCADTVDGAVSTAGLVVNVLTPIPIGMDHCVSTPTWFCPDVGVLPAVWHWKTAIPLTSVTAARLLLLFLPDSVAVQVVDELELDVLVTVQIGSPPFLKKVEEASATPPPLRSASATTNSSARGRRTLMRANLRRYACTADGLALDGSRHPTDTSPERGWWLSLARRANGARAGRTPRLTA